MITCAGPAAGTMLYIPGISLNVVADANGAFSFLYVPPPTGAPYDLAIVAAGQTAQIRSSVIAFGANDTSLSLGDILISNTTNDPNNCGACGNSCGNGSCVNSVCQAGPTCSGGLTECTPGVCTDVMNDPNHCGACNNSCGIGGVCASGTCLFICGDGIRAGVEQCDDGNLMNGDGCTNTCQIETPVCGNGVRDGAEQCDDGNSSNTDACTASCQVAACGDGVLFIGIEQCDDANASNTDACTASCQFNVCGDGFLRTGVEACDDGNTLDGDSCSSTCQAVTTPPSGSCIGMPAGTVCGAASCSNGVFQSASLCDGLGMCVTGTLTQCSTNACLPTGTACAP